MSHGHIATQLKAEVQALLATAETADQSDIPDGMNLPEEIKRLEDRLAVIAAARAKIEARAKVRCDLEKPPVKKNSAKCERDWRQAVRQAARTADRWRATARPDQLTDESCIINTALNG